MSATWKAVGLCLGAIISTLLLAVLIAPFLRKGDVAAAKAQDRRSQMALLELQEVRAAKQEILELHAELVDLKESLANSPKSRRSTDALNKIDTALLQLNGAMTKSDSIFEHLEHEDYVATTGSQLAAQNLSTAEVVVGGLSIAFAVVLFGATIFTALNLHSFKEDMSRKEQDLKELFKRLAKEQETSNAITQSQAKIDGLAIEQERLTRDLKERFRSQVEAESRTREFLGKIADLQGSAFTELIGAFPLDPAHPEAKERLLNKSLELQARMDLAQSESKRLWAAIATLAKLGTKAAIPDLGRLRDKNTTETSLALHAERSIQEIQKRYLPP